ncbi:hypothetical protein H5410_013950 [Solanum commersonii]|uniref:F-box domain-containing protein n=1 Tax=Solanum commersonii TaxID=4109 RepID=A0A9J5ZPM2_SOLCO|nr:hypothetical protein H5410_013950 [Solanum commersonii]
MKSTQIKAIPEEIIFEIFSQLPVKSLIRYRCISKFYNSLVSESDFVNLHHCRSMTRVGGRKYLMHQPEGFYTAELKEDGIGSFTHIEDFHTYSKYYPTYYRSMCVNGLFCAWSDVQHVVICNASTREVRFLPSLNECMHPNSSLYFYSIGFEPEKKKHKICLSIVVNVLEGYTRNWVFTLDTDKLWRQTKSIDCFMSQQRICLNGVIYILSYDCLTSKLKIVAFDVGAETFRILTCPYSSTSHNYDYELIEVKGKLVVLKCKNNWERDIKLWILEKDDWESHIINIPLPWKNFGIWESLNFMCTNWDNHEDIIFESNIMKIGVCDYISYDITRKSWREFKVENFSANNLCNNTSGYVESLFLLGKKLK